MPWRTKVCRGLDDDEHVGRYSDVCIRRRNWERIRSERMSQADLGERKERWWTFDSKSQNGLKCSMITGPHNRQLLSELRQDSIGDPNLLFSASESHYFCSAIRLQVYFRIRESSEVKKELTRTPTNLKSLSYTPMVSMRH